MTARELIEFLQQFAPMDLSEEWDNVGLLIGKQDDEVSSVMTCLTLTPDVAAEAIKAGAQFIVTHHPVLFRAVKQINDQTSEGRMLLDLIRAGICVYSPHTSYDSAFEGINRQLADALGLSNVQALRPVDADDDPGLGSGRFGDLAEPTKFETLMEATKAVLNIERSWFVGQRDQEVRRVGIACGAAAEFMHDAAAARCDVLLTGEARFHECLAARTLGISLILPGHYATERPAMENLAARLQSEFNELKVFASETESDPLEWV